MREIKFRAWDNKNLGWCFYTNADCMKNLYNPNCIIMQSTGLKDKNGKEIYEGDIVSEKVNRNVEEMLDGTKVFPRWVEIGRWPVEFYDNCFVLKGLMNGNYQSKYYPSLKTLEIIGNIYENPELLK